MPARKRTIKLNKASSVAAAIPADTSPVTPDDTAPLATPAADTVAAVDTVDSSVAADSVAAADTAAPDSVESSDATDTAIADPIASTDEIPAVTDTVAADIDPPIVAHIVAPASTAKPIINGRAVADDSQSAACRAAAANAVSRYYGGISKPFKSAYTKFSDLNFNNAKSPTDRQAALLLCLYLYGRGNIQPDGSFVRGNFLVPGSELGDGFNPDELYRCQPESGCLGNTLGRVITYIDGPTTGKNQRDTVLRIDHDKAYLEIRAAFSDSIAKIVHTYRE